MVSKTSCKSSPQKNTFYLKQTPTKKGSHHTFYEISIDANLLSLRYGRVGKNGRSVLKAFPDNRSARAAATQKVLSRIGEGYAYYVNGRRASYPVALVKNNIEKAKKREKQVVEEAKKKQKKIAAADEPIIQTRTRRAAAVAAAQKLQSQTMPMEICKADTCSVGQKEMQIGGNGSRVKQQPRALIPKLWEYDTTRTAYGLFINKKYCFVGNNAGTLHALSHQGLKERIMQLPARIMCMCFDNGWLYVGCGDGSVYDCSNETPRLAYSVENKSIDWLDINDGMLAVSDINGKLSILNIEGELVWDRTSAGEGEGGWVVRCNAFGVFHSHGNMVHFYAWNGDLKWSKRVSNSPVYFGWQRADSLVVCSEDSKVVVINFEGEVTQEMNCDKSVFSCTSDESGSHIFAADCEAFLYCFNSQGERLWKIPTQCGEALSMQYFDNRLYISTLAGYIACIDVSQEALDKIQQGEWATTTTTITITTGSNITQLETAMDVDVDVNVVAASAEVQTTQAAAAEGKVVLRCVLVDGSLRMRVETDGYNRDWNVQFPHNMRVEGQLYVVDGVKAAERGSYYRVFGSIQKLQL